MIHDLATLQAAYAQGERLKFLFFWRHQPAPGGSLGKECFSQWYAAPFVVDGVTYATAEHFMMAEKARLFGDEARWAPIVEAPHPGAAKQLGRQVRGFDENVWKAKRVGIVVRGNRAKFSQHPALRTYLCQTAPRILVEASPRDRIWGIGLSADNPRAEHPTAWRGTNLLGFALMAVRAELCVAG